MNVFVFLVIVSLIIMIQYHFICQLDYESYWIIFLSKHSEVFFKIPLIQLSASVKYWNPYSQSSSLSYLPKRTTDHFEWNHYHSLKYCREPLLWITVVLTNRKSSSKKSSNKQILNAHFLLETKRSERRLMIHFLYKYGLLLIT